MGWEDESDSKKSSKENAIENLRSAFRAEEVRHFEEYIQLNAQNMRKVDNYTGNLLSVQRIEKEVFVNAAHMRTDIKLDKNDDDPYDDKIMDDENF